MGPTARIEHLQISKIAKFGGVKFQIVEDSALQSFSFCYTFVLCGGNYVHSFRTIVVRTIPARNKMPYIKSANFASQIFPHIQYYETKLCSFSNSDIPFLSHYCN